MHLPFDAGMRAPQGSSTDPGAWFIEANRVSMASLTKRHSRARFDDGQAASGRVVIVSSLFLVLLTAALLIGGHAAIDPLLQSAADNRGRKQRGRGRLYDA